MQSIHKPCPYPELLAECVGHCQRCRGLCCVALYFAKSEGFPADKPPGLPCPHLRSSDFRCAIHPQLRKRGLKGCVAYDCFGAGQAAVERIEREAKRPSDPLSAPIFDAESPLTSDLFLTIFRLKQMLWFLLEASSLVPAESLQPEMDSLISENLRMTGLRPSEICSLSLEDYRQRVNSLLKRSFHLVRKALSAGAKAKARAGASPSTNAGPAPVPGSGRIPATALTAAGSSGSAGKAPDLMGKCLKGTDLSGLDLGSSLLIAADLSHCRFTGTNLLGADLRDANLDGADLSEALFLTVEQVGSAGVTRTTKLPANLRSLVSLENS